MTEMMKEFIKHQTYIAKPIEKVYDTITSASEWDQFFTTGMVLEPKPGGKCVFAWKDWGPGLYTLSADGQVVKAERPSVFAFQWYPVGLENPTTIAFELTEKLGGTVVCVTEKGYPDTHEGRAMILECASGWGEALTLMKFYLEFGVKYTPPKK